VTTGSFDLCRIRGRHDAVADNPAGVTQVLTSALEATPPVH
jgi:hypothetical protein